MFDQPFPWRAGFLLVSFWDFIYFTVLCAVAYIWRPGPQAFQYAFYSQSSQGGEAPEGEGVTDVFDDDDDEEEGNTVGECGRWRGPSASVGAHPTPCRPHHHTHCRRGSPAWVICH